MKLMESASFAGKFRTEPEDYVWIGSRGILDAYYHRNHPMCIAWQKNWIAEYKTKM